jgi:hypothetical protein
VECSFTLFLRAGHRTASSECARASSLGLRTRFDHGLHLLVGVLAAADLTLSYLPISQVANLPAYSVPGYLRYCRPFRYFRNQVRYLLRGADEFVTFPTHDTLLRTSVTIFSIPADLVDAEHRLKSVAHDGIVSYWVSECRGCCTLYSVQTRRTC